jgi:hypothetical protein
MLVGLSGPTAFYEPGDVYECDSSEAARLIGARYAIPFIEDQIERAVDAPIIEKRAKPTARKKG